MAAGYDVCRAAQSSLYGRRIVYILRHHDETSGRAYGLH